MLNKITDKELVAELLKRLKATNRDKCGFVDRVYKENDIDILSLDTVVINNGAGKLEFDCYYEGELVIGFEGEEIKKMVIISRP